MTDTMNDQPATLCTSKEAICAALSPHAAHCSAVSEGGMPCVRGPDHAGDVHAYGVPSGVTAPPVRGQICGSCGEAWPAHTFECPEYQKHGSGAPPGPRLTVRPGVSYRGAVCQTCGAASGDPCIGLRYDQVHPSRFREIESAHVAATSSRARPASPLADATATMEQIAHVIGILAGIDAAGSVPRLIDYLAKVEAGLEQSPIGLHLSPAEVLGFLRQLAPVTKAAIRLHELAMTRVCPPDGEADEA